MAAFSESGQKRKRGAKVFGFRSFMDHGCLVNFPGSFRDNIRTFLREFADIKDYTVEGMPTWCTLLVDEKSGVVVPLYNVEENVKYSIQPFCDHCRCVGWSHHFVSKRRYHFVIPTDDEWDKPLSSRIFNLQNHLLHGLIHCNGYGHLLCINGREGGSKYIRGSEFMDLWDRICTTLRTRKITVVDISRKSSMELRLLYTVAYGQPWFGRWDYNFSHGCFGVTEHMYLKAIEILSSLHLDRIIDDFKTCGKDRNIRHIIDCYQKENERQMETVRDLLLFMLELKASLPLQRTTATPMTYKSIKKSASSSCRWNSAMAVAVKKGHEFSKMVTTMASRWSSRRLEFAAQVIVDELKAKKDSCSSHRRNVWMSRQDVRDAGRLHIGDTGLLDFVLKSIGGCIVGNHIVIRATNPLTRVLEYTVKDIAEEDTTTTIEPVKDAGSAEADSIGRMEVHQDLLYVYKHVLEDYPVDTLSEPVQLAARAILDGKHLMKTWPFHDDDDQLLRYVCQMVTVVMEEPEGLTRPAPPPELVVVPLHATIRELKQAAEQALRDTYCALELFNVWGIEGVDEPDDEVLFGTIESGSRVWLRGSGVDLDCDLRYEGGADNWTVNCTCGARDDDGERMVACDICEVWQHTRCGGIDESDAVPPLFLCWKCGDTLMLQRQELLGDM